jgi:acetylornithine deacetylase
MTPTTRSLEFLHRLLGFSTITRQSNLELIEWVRGQLQAHGIDSRIVHDETGTKANLHATTGPAGEAGILLSGHSDVVPVAGQDWTVPPFEATDRDGRIYGRGAADMKGFIACALDAMLTAAQRPLKRPLSLALSYDEEIGCVGVRRLLDVLELDAVRPALCVVGEPTSMRVATGHKGKVNLRATCHGLEGHSALAPKALNAIHLASDMVSVLRQTQDRLATEGSRDDDYDIPYTTVHVGVINGGTALNIVPNRCTMDFEIRYLQADDPAPLLDGIRAQAEDIAGRARAHTPKAGIDIETVNEYPGLDTHPTSQAVAFIESMLAHRRPRMKVAFGTEGGLFTQRLDVPVVVCGPGSMDQGHKPDEYVTHEQMHECDAFMAKIVASLCA